MVGQDRRGFLRWLAAGLLSLVPASVVGQELKGKVAPKRMAKPIDDDFGRVLAASKVNHVRVLKASKLTPEEKLAIATVRELKAPELEAVTAKLHGAKDLGASTGMICGGGCGGGGGDTGIICGANCGKLGAKAEAVVDPQGLLQLNMKTLNAAATLQALDKAIELGKQAAR